MEVLDQENSACALVSVDFAKAFNSMSHCECLAALRRYGCTEHLIGMIAAFLYDRKLQFKVGNEHSSKRTLRGGAPQGTLLGNYLFILTTDSLDKGEQDTSDDHDLEESNKSGEGSKAATESTWDTSEEASGVEDVTDASVTDGSATPRQSEATNLTSTPHHPSTHNRNMSPADDDDFVYFKEFRRPFNRLEDTRLDATSYTLSGSVLDELNPAKAAWRKIDRESLKFVDDFLAMEHIPVTSAYNIFSTDRVKSILHARDCQNFFTAVKENATAIGMTVNDSKTQLICISAIKERDMEVYFRLPNGQKIAGQNSLKQLGFTFGHRPNMDEHVAKMSLKFRKRLWYLRHLKAAGVDQTDLLAVYKCFLLSILDYAAVIYGCMITKEQTHDIEMLQSSALKIIYGQALSYAKLIEKSGVDTLEERRQKLIDKFIVKAAENPKFQEEWFPQKNFIHHDLRNERIYEEKYARTERLYRCPIYTYRRRLNEIYLHDLNRKRD